MSASLRQPRNSALLLLIVAAAGCGTRIAAGPAAVRHETPATQSASDPDSLSQAADPDYQAWTRFRPGSSTTLTGDMDTAAVPANTTSVQYVWRFTLRDFDAKAAWIGWNYEVTLDGKADHGYAPDMTYPAESCSDDRFRMTGATDLTAMGRRFHCRVWQGHGGWGPCSGDDPITIYRCDEVPGGLVKYVGDGPGRSPVTLTVCAFDVK